MFQNCKNSQLQLLKIMEKIFKRNKLHKMQRIKVKRIIIKGKSQKVIWLKIVTESHGEEKHYYDKEYEEVIIYYTKAEKLMKGSEDKEYIIKAIFKYLTRTTAMNENKSRQ